MNETNDRPVLTTRPPREALSVAADAREERLAAALRANLRRRKAAPGRGREPGAGA